VYPEETMKKHELESNYPKCIFKPSVWVLRKMIEAIVSKAEDFSFENFMLKFGLLLNEEEHLNPKSLKVISTTT
jgi:hypothetical protein